MSDGSTPIIVFLNGGPLGSEIIWAPIDSIVPPNVAYNFSPTNNDTIPSHYTNIGTGYVYSYTPPAPVPQPNVIGFCNAIMADTSIPTEAQAGLGSWYANLNMFINWPQTIRNAWQILIATYSGSWLTQQVQTSVQTYAQIYNIPLI